MNIIHRRKGTAVSEVATEELDTRPLYLRVFPSPSSMLHDIELGVLMGRQDFPFFSRSQYSTVPNLFRHKN
jgi:hypothetical protein